MTSSPDGEGGGQPKDDEWWHDDEGVVGAIKLPLGRWGPSNWAWETRPRFEAVEAHWVSVDQWMTWFWRYDRYKTSEKGRNFTWNQSTFILGKIKACHGDENGDIIHCSTWRNWSTALQVFSVVPLDLPDQDCKKNVPQVFVYEL